MPLAPAIAASLSAGLPTRARSLWVGGLDVMLQPGVSGNGYGVPIESVVITEGGPNTVSSMTFTIDDPLLVVALAEGMLVQQQWHTRDVPEFLGFVQSWSVRGVGPSRQIDVIAQGVEAILDWLMIPSLVIPAGTGLAAAIQSAYANAVGTAGIPLRALSAGAQSNQAAPIDGSWLNTLQFALTLTNVSLRQAIQQIAAAVIPDDPAFAGYFLETTVDFYAGLRVWTSLNNIGGPADYTTVPANQGASNHENLSHTTDAGGAIHNVIVVGGNAAGSGLVTDGSGLPGKTGILNDPTSLTAAQRNIVGRAYLQDKGTLAIRGTVVRSEPSFEALIAPGSVEVHPGGQLQLTNAQAGQAAAIYRLTGITKRILPSNKCVWTFRYGGNPPRATEHIRRLTKDRFR